MSRSSDFAPMLVAAVLLAAAAPASAPGVVAATPPVVAVDDAATASDATHIGTATTATGALSVDDTATGNDTPTTDDPPTDDAATASNAANTSDAVTDATAAPEIVALYPNPVADGDSGEFVVLRFPGRANASRWALADGESTVPLPNATVSGRVALSVDPEAARNLTDATVLALTGDLRLANSGETVRLVVDDTAANEAEASATESGVNAVVGSVTYEDAPESERYHRVRSGGHRSGPGTNRGGRGGVWQWTPLGATDFEVARTGPTDARAFVLPDSPAIPLETIRNADRRVLLGGYTFASERVADALASATRRGVEVRVLVDGAPVGGMSRREGTLLDSLVARGVEVLVLGGPRARYDFHHAKYAVADDRALVATENWKPSGTGGHANRGWGAVVRSETVADRLAAVFEADAGWRGTTPWSEFRASQSFVSADGPSVNERYPSEIASRNVNVSSSSVLIAPDNAENALIDLLDAADESIRVQQAAIGGRKHSLLGATLRAARRGVEVRILLSSAWYVEEENRRLVEWLNRRAEARNLSLEARVADPRNRYEKIHAKGVVVDGDAAVVGSLNWNNHSARENREVAVVLRGEDAGGFYAGAFDADWRASAGGGGSGGTNRLPVGLLAAVAVGALAAILYANREVAFEE